MWIIKMILIQKIISFNILSLNKKIIIQHKYLLSLDQDNTYFFWEKSFSNKVNKLYIDFRSSKIYIKKPLKTFLNLKLK